MALAVMSGCVGHHTETPRKKKTKSILYLAFSTCLCRSSMGKGKRRLINDSRKRLERSIGVGALVTSTYRPIELTELGDDSDQFVVGIDLSAIPEAAQFVGRENELAEMRRLLHGHKSRSVVVLHGLGGIGKTQLAIEYTTRHKEKYTAVFWLNTNDEDSLKSSFRDIAQHILEEQKGMPSTSTLASVDLNGNPDQVVTVVKTWLGLQRNTRWLMIYDNYDNPRVPGNLDSLAVDIRKFLPRADHGSVIITTRSAQVSQGYRIHVQKLPNIYESLKILSNTSKRENIENGRLSRT
jgi:hypothetical protein